MTQLIALLGRKDEPTDAVEEYCRYLGAALRSLDFQLEIRRLPWQVDGWPEALRNPATEGRSLPPHLGAGAIHGSWLVGTCLPSKVPTCAKIVKSAGARVGLVFHDVEPYAGSRLAIRSGALCRSAP